MKMKKTNNPSTAFLATTLEDLDKILYGGIACGSLTEVKGGHLAKLTCICLFNIFSVNIHLWC